MSTSDQLKISQLYVILTDFGKNNIYIYTNIYVYTLIENEINE